MLKPLLLIFLFGFHFIFCHVALTFPPARSYAFDYLDSFTFRSRGPCGERKTSGAFKTSLKANSTATFTFHMSFVHQGGFSFKLLYDCGDSNSDRGCKEMFLTNGIVSRKDVLTQSYNVSIPNMECRNCVVLLTRQGAEYGSSYNFWSCADVSIVGKVQCTENNNNRPNRNEVPITLLSSILSIQSLSQSAREKYSQLLQSYLSSPSPRPRKCNRILKCYEGKCQNDGTCSTTTGECRCQRLFSGDRCQYMDECWTDEDCSYQGRCIDTKSTTYPILQCYCDPGWFGSNCEKVSDVASVPSDLSRYESHQFRYGGPRIYWTYYKNYAEIEIVITLPTRSWVGVGWKSVQTNSRCKVMDPVLEVERKRLRALKLLRQRQVNFTTSEPAPHPDPEAENFCRRRERQKRSTRVKRQSYRINGGMDCADIVVGSVKGNRHRVRDMWTRECSKPLPDEYFGGTDDLTAAFGQQVGESTTIVFRKKTRADHHTDHSPQIGQQRVIWAHGQNRDTRFCTKNNTSFYRQDELKYHRYERGRQNFAFTRPAVLPDAYSTSSPTTSSPTTNAPVTCTRSGQLKKPSDCNENGSDFNCEIVVSWELDSDNATIIFIVQGMVEADQYIAIGISDNLQMPETDIYSSHITNGELQVVDRWASQRSFPSQDEDQNVQVLTGSYSNGILTSMFSRPKASANSFDLGFDNNQCRHILYAKGSGEMSYHGRQKGFLTDNKLCIPSCN